MIFVSKLQYQIITEPNLQVFDNLSNDRQLLYLLIIGVEKGDISNVKDRAIGRAHQARWLTLSSRLIRIYCSVPSYVGAYEMEKLERMAMFIIRIYFKVWLTFLSIKLQQFIVRQLQ